jgi:hypothetical protein
MMRVVDIVIEGGSAREGVVSEEVSKGLSSDNNGNPVKSSRGRSKTYVDSLQMLLLESERVRDMMLARFVRGLCMVLCNM